MRSSRRLFIALICIIAGIVLQGSTSKQVKTLTRIHDPVVMEGKLLKPLLGTPICDLALMARQGDKLIPIPFQIDQKKPDGTYAFAVGPGAGKDPDPNFDANDELVFMVKDTGDLANGNWPKGAKKILQIEATDPKNGKKGWLYLVRFAGKAPRSKEDYIRVEIDDNNKYRKVISYEYVMGGPMNMMYPDMMAAVRPGGKFGKDVLDRLKIRGDIHLTGGLKIPYQMDEMTRSKDIGYIDGTVRVLHFAEGFIQFTKRLKIKGKGHSVIAYYANHLVWPLVVDVNWAAIPIVKKVDLYGYLDFCPAVYGSYSFSAANPLNKKIVFDGKMSEAEKNIDTKSIVGWIAGFGPEGAIMSRMVVEPSEGTELYHYYEDDKNKVDAPEDCPGVSSIGYRIEGTDQQVRNTITWIYFFFFSNLKPKEVSQVLDMYDHKVKIKVKSI